MGWIPAACRSAGQTASLQVSPLWASAPLGLFPRWMRLLQARFLLYRDDDRMAAPAFFALQIYRLCVPAVPDEWGEILSAVLVSRFFVPAVPRQAAPG